MHACRFPSALFSEGWEKGKGGSIHPQGDIRDPLHIYILNLQYIVPSTYSIYIVGIIYCSRYMSHQGCNADTVQNICNGGGGGSRVQNISCRELYAVHSTANDIVQCTEYCSTA